MAIHACRSKIILHLTFLCDDFFKYRYSVTQKGHRVLFLVYLFNNLMNVIRNDGSIQDASYHTTGHLRSDGTVQDSGYRTVGHIKSDGTVQDSGYRTIGHVKSDGTVQDASYHTIGHASGIPLRWAALYFFFCK